MTKPIVATGVLRLVERGDLLLHEPVANNWPEFAVNGKADVTLWHLLTHTSGLDENFGTPSSRDLPAWETEQVRRATLNFPPGSRRRADTPTGRRYARGRVPRGRARGGDPCRGEGCRGCPQAKQR